MQAEGRRFGTIWWAMFITHGPPFWYLHSQPSPNTRRTCDVWLWRVSGHLGHVYEGSDFFLDTHDEFLLSFSFSFLFFLSFLTLFQTGWCLCPQWFPRSQLHTTLLQPQHCCDGVWSCRSLSIATMVRNPTAASTSPRVHNAQAGQCRCLH